MLEDRIAALEQALLMQTEAAKLACEERDYCEQVLLRLGHATERHVKTFVEFASRSPATTANHTPFRSVAAVGRHLRFTAPFSFRDPQSREGAGGRDFNDVATAIVSQQNAVAIILPRLDLEHEETSRRHSLQLQEAETRVVWAMRFAQVLIPSSRFNSRPPDLLQGVFRAVKGTELLEVRHRAPTVPITPSASSISSSPSSSMSSLSDGGDAVPQSSVPVPTQRTASASRHPQQQQQQQQQHRRDPPRVLVPVQDVVEQPGRVSPCRGVASPTATVFLQSSIAGTSTSSSVPRLTGVRGTRAATPPARTESPVVRRKWLGRDESGMLSPLRAPSPRAVPLRTRASPSASLLETPPSQRPAGPSNRTSPSSERGSLLGTPTPRAPAAPDATRRSDEGRGAPSVPELAAQLTSSLDASKRRAVENALRTILAAAGSATPPPAAASSVRKPSPGTRRSSPATAPREPSQRAPSRQRTPSPNAVRAWR